PVVAAAVVVRADPALAVRTADQSPRAGAARQGRAGEAAAGEVDDAEWGVGALADRVRKRCAVGAGTEGGTVGEDCPHRAAEPGGHRCLLCRAGLVPPVGLEPTPQRF